MIYFGKEDGMKKIILGVFGLIVIALLFFGYKMYQAITGTAKPRDLGITATMEQANAAQTKTTVQVIALPASTDIGQSIRFEGTKPMAYSMDSAELTALALFKTTYRYFPFHSVQIRINADNSVELSGLADTAKAVSYATAIGFAASDVEKAMKDYNIPSSNVSFYVKGSGSVTNGAVTLDIQGGEIAGIPVPMGLVNSKKAAIVDILESGMKNTPGFEAKSITFSDGKVHFNGSLSEKEYIVQ